MSNIFDTVLSRILKTQNCYIVCHVKYPCPMKLSSLHDYLVTKQENTLKTWVSPPHTLRIYNFNFNKEILLDYFSKTDEGYRQRVHRFLQIAEIIAKTGSAHTVGEGIIIPAVEAVISDVMNQDPYNDSSCKGIDEMSNTIRYSYSTLENNCIFYSN